MKATLAKSVFVGLAALTFVSVAQPNVNAASKAAKTKSNKVLKTKPETRNVVPTGKYAIYSYPKTVKKSAKVVASKATVKKLAASKKSTDYFRAYRVLKTSRGSVYYKVVSFNGKYRGYIYGGKNASKFAKGLKLAETTTPVQLTADQTAKSYYFAKPGKANVTWTAPKNTQYKKGASKVVSDTETYKNDALKVTSAVKKTREGTEYYYVKDATNPKVDGWIYSKAVTDVAPAAANSVKINYKTAAGKVVKTSTYTPANTVKVGDDVTKAVTDSVNKTVATDLSGTGYNYTATDSSNVAALKDVKAGSSLDLIVSQNAEKTSSVAFKVSGTGTVGPSDIKASDLVNGTYPLLTADQQKAFTGTGDTVVSMNNLESTLLDANKPLNKLTGVTQKSSDGTSSSTATYTFDKATTEKANASVKYGDKITLYYTEVTETVNQAKTSTPAATTTGNADYAK